MPPTIRWGGWAPGHPKGYQEPTNLAGRQMNPRVPPGSLWTTRWAGWVDNQQQNQVSGAVAGRLPDPYPSDPAKTENLSTPVKV